MSSDSAFDPYGISSPSIPVYKPGMKSWSDLRKTVQETQKILSPLACSVPSSFTFRIVNSNSGKKIRLYFLGIPPKCRETTLMYVDVPNELDPSSQTLQWKTLLDSFQLSLSSVTTLSKEEQLLRERKRSGIFGISSYDYANGNFFFYACNKMFHCCDNDFSEDPIVPSVMPSSCPSAKIDQKICPKNSNLLAYVQDCDIWVSNILNEKEMRLTYVNSGSHNLLSDSRTAGVPSFVTQEEFNRFTGYWWQNDGCVSENGICRILYEEVDEGDVDIINIFSSTSDESDVDKYRYPRAGTTNARSTLKIVEFEVLSDGSFSDKAVIREMQDPLSSIFPWSEYVVRAGWVPDSNFIYAQLLNRSQTKISLVLIPLSCFIPMTSDVEMDQHNGNSIPPVQVIYEDASDIWINVHNILKFTETSSDSKISFIFASEKSGNRHLYHVTSKIIRENHSQNGLFPDQALKPDVLNETQLTNGDWEVLPDDIWVDKDKKIVYFLGLKNNPLESHLYVASYITPSEPELLTQLGYSHSISFSSDLSHFVSLYSSAQNSMLGDIYQVKDIESKLSCDRIGSLMDSTDITKYSVPELFHYQSKFGHKVYGMFYRPQDQEPNVKYPTVLFVYGGPQVQLVSNAFKGLKLMKVHPLVAQGYVVVIIDGRGSNNRGLQFESHLKHKLGTIEIEDQVEGLQYLASQEDFIDLNRVAIHGWSYGGYLSLMGLAQRPDVFKVAIAGAPVVDWHLYDTGYTERYMDTPQNNEESYKNSSVLNYVDRFPDEANRLLIVHGLMDENVHFQHSSSLINALVKAGKPYQLQVYPNERHGIRNHDANEHYKTMILNFLQHNL